MKNNTKTIKSTNREILKFYNFAFVAILCLMFFVLATQQTTHIRSYATNTNAKLVTNITMTNPQTNLTQTTMPNNSETSEITTSKYINLPILMYHKVLNARKDTYIVSAKQLEQDIIALQKNGYTTVFLSQVVDYIDNKAELPDKPIVLTFDDGSYNNLHYVLPLAKKYNVKFTIFPVTAYSLHSMDTNDIGNVNYSYLTFQQMAELVDTGLVEIGNHTHDLHHSKPRHGIKKLKKETFDQYQNAIQTDIQKANELIHSAGIPTPTAFAYPFGAFSKESKSVLQQMGFRTLLTCIKGINKIDKQNPNTLLELKRLNRDGKYTTDKLMQIIKKYENKNQ